MNPLESIRVQCPYCWEVIDLLIDCSEPEQECVEDCPVCCRPITVRISTDGGELAVTVRAEAD